MFTAPDLQEENMLLEKSNRQKVLEIEKLTHTVGELEESILAAGDVANAVHFYQNQATRLNVSEICQCSEVWIDPIFCLYHNNFELVGREDA
jgi:hypothetical protein